MAWRSATASCTRRTITEVLRADLMPDGSLGPPTLLIGDLPDSGGHDRRTLGVGPDRMLYVSVGSSCNACVEKNPELATILRATPDGRSRSVFASGLRNSMAFDWEPTTGALWAADNGIDNLGDDQQPEELNQVREGKRYGWPHVYGRGDINEQTPPPAGSSREQWRSQSEPMVIGYTAHTAPMQLVFYRGASFPADYAGDAFLSFHGSWNRQPASGFEVVRVRFADGQAQSFEPFLSGFLVDGGRHQFGRPMGLAVMDDGALLVADDSNGVLYRVSYRPK
jgi:glucose/arabinose dehydrogenase